MDLRWQNNPASIIGIVLHQHLQFLCQFGLYRLQHFSLQEEQKKWRSQLLNLGLLPDELPYALHILKQAWENLQHDTRAAWILDNKHRDSHAEYALSWRTEEGYQHYILDRTFIDEQGTRWIIDYKTSQAHHLSPSEFLQQEQAAYRQQLENYARIFAELDTRPIKLGLYFPLLPAWIEWAYGTSLVVPAI